MKRIITFLTLIIASFTCNAQSTALRNSFNELNKTFKNYEIKSQGVYDAHFFEGYYTKSWSISYVYPDLIITYVEGFKPGCGGGNTAPGKYKLVIPLSTTDIEQTETYDKSNSYLYFRNNSGITKTYNGRSEIIEKTYFYATKLTISKLYNELQDFKRQLQYDGFRGSLGIGNTQSNNSKKSTTQTKTKVTSQPKPLKKQETKW